MQISNNNNNNVNFQAKLYLRGNAIENSPRWQKIAKNFETKTAKSFPEYEIELFQDDRYLISDRLPLEIRIDRGSHDDLCLREHKLSPDGADNLMQLSNSKIIKKLTNLLTLVKKRDKMMDQLPDDIAKLEKKYGIELDQNSYDRVVDALEDKVHSANYVKIAEDNILSDFVESSNIFN